MWAAQSGKYVQLIFVVGYGVALFGEIPTLSTIMGAVTVCVAVTYISILSKPLDEPQAFLLSTGFHEWKYTSRRHTPLPRP